ncbi:hypothetical protein ACE6H2_016334 [Prunus campanulata]
MAPKKSSSSAPDTSSSGTVSIGSAFLFGSGVKDFAAVFDGWVERFAAGRAQFFLCKDAISFMNDHCILGPRYFDQKLDQLWNYEVHPIRALVPAFRKGGVDWSNWNKMLPRFFPKIDVSSVELRWADWVNRMEPRYRDRWLDNVIYQAITCSVVQPQADPSLLGSALVFWNSASNTFDFGVGPMSISILDLAVIFGFRPHGRSADWLGDFEDGPSQEKERKKNLEVLIDLIGSNRAYGAFMGAFMDQDVDYPDGEHVMFLLYWLNRFIFPSASNYITMEWLHLAEGLSSYRDIATGPLILASIYRALREATVEPINLNVKGPLWMVQVWLQWTFLKLRARKLRVTSTAVPLRELLLSTASGKTTEECFTFFLCWKTRHASQWLMNLKRGSPWFENRSISQGPRDGKAPLAFENMDIFSCLQTRDLPCGGRMDSRNYQYGVEAYSPQFFSRQFGCPQVIPELDYSLINKGSSYRFPKLSKDDLLGIRAKIRELARILELRPYRPDCFCTQSFRAWWDHYLSRYGHLHEAYPRVFKNCPFRRDLKSGDKRILFEQIAEDNQLSLTVLVNYQSLCTPSQLTTLGQGIAGGLKTPIFAQLGQKERAPISPVLQAGGDPPSFPSHVARVATKKRSQPEEPGSGAKEKARSEVASSKWARTSSVEVPGAVPVGLSSSPLMVPPPSTVLPSDGSEGRAAEVGSATEVAGLVPQEKEARGEATSDADNRTEVALDTSIPVETVSLEEVPEEAVPVAEDPAAEVPAEKSGQEGNAPDDDAPRAREDAPEIPVATPAAEPSFGSASAKAPGDSGTGSSDTTFISNARAKILLGKWLALPLEDKVADEQGAKVLNALDSICRACPDFATFCETAKTSLETLVEARLARVQVQKRELQAAADHMLTTLSLAKEELDKADMDVGLELWSEKLKKIRVDRLRVDVLHFSDKIKTLLDLLV